VPDITYPSATSPLPGYLAVPDGDGPCPGVVIVQDVLGLTADLKRITDRFAASGYLALAPALYGREAKIKCMISTIRAHFAGTGAAYDDLVAARDYLIADTRCTGKVGLAGFCMGAGFCLQLAPRGLFDATAPNYGLLPKNIDALRRSCPLVASFGAKDRIVARGTAAKLEAVLAQGDVARDVKEYPDVAHSFMNNWGVPGPIRVVERFAGMAYSEPEAEDAWQRMLSFFEDHLTT
jgi:carboxymethylenebutenolidase